MKLNNKGITLVEIIISIALISLVLIFMFSLLINVNDMNISSKINSQYLVNKALITKNIEEDLNISWKIELYKCEIKDFYPGYNPPTNYTANMCLQFRLYKDKTNTTTKEDAYLGLYYYNGSAKSNYVISYINEIKHIKITRELPDFEMYNINSAKTDLKNLAKITIENSLPIRSSAGTSTDKTVKTYSNLHTICSSHPCPSPSYEDASRDIFYNGGSHVMTATSTSTYFGKITIPIIGSDNKDYSLEISLSPKW